MFKIKVEDLKITKKEYDLLISTIGKQLGKLSGDDFNHVMQCIAKLDNLRLKTKGEGFE